MTMIKQNPSEGFPFALEQIRIKKYHMGHLKGLCMEGFENLNVGTVPFNQRRFPEDSPFFLHKASRSRCTISFNFTSKGITRRVFAKRYRTWRFSRKLGYLFVPSKALTEWRLAFALLDKKIYTPLPLVVAELKIGPFIRENYLVTLSMDPFKPVKEILRELPEAEKTEALLRKLAQFIRLLHDAGFYHDDLSLNHVFALLIPNAPPKFAIIDLDNGRFYQTVPQYKRAYNLFQIFVSIESKLLPPEKRSQFLEHYLSHSPSKEIIQRINSISRRKTGSDVV